ncbi:MAG: enoyl-CoA hydratase-related protein, partial [Alphaproteobacteria bacterium]|nr:enoyl-CoA hydratase-related protein [Alphaproteobacteria bacterium]
FAETYSKFGLLPGGGGAYFLPRLVGKARALELLWTADFVDAATALEIGLVNHVYPDDQLLSETTKLAKRIATMPPLSIQLIKRTVNQSLETDMETAFDLVSSHIAIARAGHDHGEAIKAFREKRTGNYVGY